MCTLAGKHMISVPTSSASMLILCTQQTGAVADTLSKSRQLFPSTLNLLVEAAVVEVPAAGLSLNE
jgi:hypothetical protein